MFIKYELLHTSHDLIYLESQMRKLATIQTIHNISPIKGADNISVAEVLGWEVVVKNG